MRALFEGVDYSMKLLTLDTKARIFSLNHIKMTLNVHFYDATLNFRCS